MRRALGQLLAVVLVAGGMVGGHRALAHKWGGGGAASTQLLADTTKASIRSPQGYEDFLAFLDYRGSEARFTQSVVRRHLDALSVVLPDRMAERLRIYEGAESGAAESLADRAGRAVGRWWHRRDPYPATSFNERLREHLQRTKDAFDKYSREDDSNRLDDRGRVYIRFGPPDRKRELDIGKEGEFWVYASHPAAEYVFIRDRGDGYKLGPPTDLLPGRLRRGFGPSRRGFRKAVQSLSMLERVYEQLSHFRSRYGITFADLSMYKEQVRQAMSGLPTSFSVRPHTYATQKIQEIRHEEAEATQRRKEVLPRIQSEAGNAFGDIPVGARWVRSLTAAGSTQVKLYWSVPRSSLRPTDDQAEVVQKHSGDRGGYLLSSSLVQFSESYERQEVRTHHLFSPEEPGARGVLTPQEETFMLKETPHAALQVDVAWASVQGESKSVRPKAKLKVGTSRIDSLESLNDDPSVLEMSDLRPTLLRTDSTSILEAPVYPFEQLSSTDPLALRFDVYHLSKDSNGRTQYTIEYEVLRKTNRGGFARLLNGNDEERTAVRSRFEGRRARTEEYVVLDPENWGRGDPQTVRITVRVTDEHSGEAVARSVQFTLSSAN